MSPSGYFQIEADRGEKRKVKNRWKGSKDHVPQNRTDLFFWTLTDFLTQLELHSALLAVFFFAKERLEVEECLGTVLR